MKKYLPIAFGLLVLLLGALFLFVGRSFLTPAGNTVGGVCPYTFVSWNVANFGQSKTDEDIAIMAETLRHADIVAIQEVTAGRTVGAQAVAKLAIALSRTGSSWDYIVSDPTAPASPGVERYAFLWKSHAVSVNRDGAQLVRELEDVIDREPFAAEFAPKNVAKVNIMTIHAVPAEKGPRREVEALTKSREIGKSERMIVAGDFNLPPKKTDSLFLAIGMTGHIREATSLTRMVRSGNYRRKQFDNVYTKGIEVCSAGVIDFVGEQFAPVDDATLSRAREVSDHLPVMIRFR